MQEPTAGQKFVLCVYVALVAALVVGRGVQLKVMKMHP